VGRGWWIGPTGHTAPGRPRPGQFYGEGNSGGPSRLVGRFPPPVCSFTPTPPLQVPPVGRSCHVPVFPPVRPSVRPSARPFVCPFQVRAVALFSPRDRAIALQPTPTWVFGDSNPPQKPVAGCSPCCTCTHLETQPLHRWRRWRWGYPSFDVLLPLGPPAKAEWSSVDLPTGRGRLWPSGLVPCGRSIPLE